MSKKTSAPSGPVEVRALIDHPTHGLLAGKVVSVPAELLETLKASGLVDDHPDAVAYAKTL